MNNKYNKRELVKAFIMCVAAFLLLFLVLEVRADDYSNDFEFQMRDYDNEGSMHSRTNYDSDSNIGNYNPFGLNEVIEDQRRRKLLKSIYKRDKYTYRPYSPNKRHHRMMTNPTVIKD